MFAINIEKTFSRDFFGLCLKIFYIFIITILNFCKLNCKLVRHNLNRTSFDMIRIFKKVVHPLLYSVLYIYLYNTLQRQNYSILVETSQCVFLCDSLKILLCCLFRSEEMHKASKLSKRIEN